MTFTLVARCPQTGQFGIALSSSSPAVAARCAHARAGVGAVASQNVTDPALGPMVLDRLEAGLSARDALDAVVRDRAHIGWRQLLVVDAVGRTAIFTGDRALGTLGEASGDGAVAAGNLLASATVPQAIIDAFLAAPGAFGDRLMAGLRAGLAAGGEAGPVHSAGLKIVDRLSWPVVDVRVDWDEDDPIGRLAQLWHIYAPQAEAYVRRAEAPEAAPGYGVPGDRR